MKLRLIGCSHHNASISVREQLAFSTDQVPRFLERFYGQFPMAEAVLVSTCNRTELYAAGGESELVPSHDELAQLLSDDRKVDVNTAETLFRKDDRNAVEHLFTVASSLDSMVIGEPQILSQVKQAYQLATRFNSGIPHSHQLFQTAIRVARRIANDTEIHSNRVSVPSVAIGSLALRVFERLDNKRCLVIGAGEMAAETLTYLRSFGGKDIVVINRTLSRAQDLADEFDGRVAEWSELKQQIIEADLIVSTTGSDGVVVGKELFDELAPARNQRPLLILDLALPRDFDPEIDVHLNVYLYSIDDLQRECERNRESRKSERVKAEKILEQETVLFMREVKFRRSGSTIVRLKEQANEIKVAELRRLMNRLDSVDPKHQSEIEYAFDRLVNKILHPPLESLKDESREGGAGLLEALKRLFQLND